MAGAQTRFASHSINIGGDTGGFEIALRRGGAGEPVLFLHGNEGLSQWPAFLDRLAETHDVIAPDHPGFGQSATPDWMDDISDLAYAYLSALEKLGLNRVHVVGHSLGAWIGLEMAVRSQERLRDLTLLAPAGLHVKGAAKADIFLIDPDEQSRMAYVDPALGEAAAARATAEKYQEVAIRERIASARFGWNPRFYNPRLGRWLHRIHIPALIVWGDSDRIFSPLHGPAFQERIPGAELVTIKDCGHLPHLEKPEETLDAMRRFLRR